MDERVNGRAAIPGWLIALGASLWGLTIGAIAVLALRRNRDGLSATTPINIHFSGLAGPLAPPLSASQLATPYVDPNAQPVTLTPARTSVPTKLATYTLQTDRVSRVMTAASDNYWKAQLRNVGPPGSIARVANEPNLLAYPSMAIAIPAGAAYEIKVQPGVSLFAISDTANTELSVAAGEDLT